MPMNLALIVFALVVMLLSISLHDCAQAWMANRLGDPTARMVGRITLNPVPHFDLFGTGLWPLMSAYFSSLPLGWGKPVPMTYRNFRRKDGEMLAILAGPAAQLGTAFVCLVLLVFLKHTGRGVGDVLAVAVLVASRVPLNGLEGLPALFPLLLFLYFGIVVNLLLFVFNLVPVPFLDGGKILSYFLPYNAQRTFEQYSFYIMIAFFFFGMRLIMLAFSPLLGIFTNLLMKL